jgi:hypothetical protein
MSNTLITYLFIFLMGFVLGLHTCSSCNRSGNGSKGCDTVVVRDTVVIIQPPQQTEIHIPQLVETVRVDSFIAYEYITDSNCKEAYNDLAVSANALLNEMHTRRTYDSTYKFTNADVGVKFEVYKNKAQNIQVGVSNIKEKVITNNITAKPKGSLYLGAGGGWSPKDTMMNIATSFLFKTKGGKMYEIGASLNTRGIITYEGKVYFPLIR